MRSRLYSFLFFLCSFFSFLPPFLAALFSLPHAAVELDPSDFPELVIDGHLVQVVADLVQQFLRTTTTVHQALLRNNHTRAGDEPRVRAKLVDALAELARCGIVVAHVERFLQAQPQPILLELAEALAEASAHARDTERATPLLLNAATAMQSCARRLTTEGVTDSTRAFLTNARTQFESCCTAHDWQLLRALVDIHGLLRFGVAGAGFDGDSQHKLTKVSQPLWSDMRIG